MRIDVVTLFPELIDHAPRFGVTGRALGEWAVAAPPVEPARFPRDNHRTVDDRPYGGGPGMVMLPEPLRRRIEAARPAQMRGGGAVSPDVLLSPSGERLGIEPVRELLGETTG